MYEEWYGMLTMGNLEEVARRIEGVLKGKPYTFTTFNEGSESLEVRTGQHMNRVSTYRGEGGDHGGFHVNDTYGVWGCSTNLTEDKYDPEYNNPYIVIGNGQVKMSHRAPAGHKLYWIAAVEK